jgi:hypothetical protein
MMTIYYIHWRESRLREHWKTHIVYCQRRVSRTCTGPPPWNDGMLHYTKTRYIALQGIEPRFVEPKSTVMPLYERAVGGVRFGSFLRSQGCRQSRTVPLQPFVTSDTLPSPYLLHPNRYAVEFQIYRQSHSTKLTG